MNKDKNNGKIKAGRHPVDSTKEASSFEERIKKAKKVNNENGDINNNDINQNT